MLENYDIILVPEEICEILRIGHNEVYKLLKNGDIPGYKVGKTWRIPKQNVINYINTKIK
ncbi:MAG: helix-turn-helix domain-containing protein [Eubacterium sp.]|nr:helix-turn-helix domain-containing protein [Eubacterium sp.]